jgi:NAD(P)-dependent dehydrogenase (short-subunit alcohol dehydrogenase family)
MAFWHPIGKFILLDEVANAVVFLLSDKSSWTTGAILDVYYVAMVEEIN